MFDNIRDKFVSLQENISSTLRGFTITDPTYRKQATTQNVPLNFNAGTAILENFQSSWSELHEALIKNSEKAQVADELICNIHKYAEKQWKDLSCLTGVISCLPELICLLNDLSHKAATLEGLFDAVEKELIELEDVIDARKFHKKEEEQRLQLVLHKERRLAMLQNLKCDLQKRFKEKLQNTEFRVEKPLPEEQIIPENSQEIDIGEEINESNAKCNFLENIVQKN